MSVENWQPIPGYEGYEVSDQGNVRTVRRWRRNRYSGFWYEPRPVTQHVEEHGHRAVFLYPEPPSARNRNKRWYVHRAVLTAFVGLCPDGMEGCHRDGNPANNRLDNLYWGTKSQNQLDSVRHRTHNSIQKAGRTHCKWGHEWTPENCYYPPHPNSKRMCRQCLRDRGARYRKEGRIGIRSRSAAA